MSVSQNLFELIKSLNPAEKRYFKVFAKRHVKGDVNNYVLLFNAIDKQIVYDESKLLKKFQNKGLFRHFSSEKNYLYKLILKSMNAYELDKTTDAKIREQIGFITFLHRKRLFQQALKQLDKTKKLAIKYEHHYYLTQILHLETGIIHNAHELEYQKRLSNNQVEMQEALQKANLLHQHQTLFGEVFWKNNKRLFASNEEQINYFRKVSQSDLLQKTASSTDFQIQKIRYQTLQICYLQTHQLTKSYEYAQELIQLYEVHPHFLKYFSSEYIAALGNIIVSCYHLGDWEGVYQTIQKMRKIQTQSISEQIHIFETTYNAEIAYYQNKEQFDKVKELLVVIGQKLHHYGKKIRQPNLLIWYYNLSGLHFFLRDFPKALEFINHFFDLYTSGVREDTYNKAIYLNLLIHWELGNHQLLESLVRTAERYVRQKNSSYSLELPILSFFKKMLNLPIGDSPKRLSLLQSMNNKFERLGDSIERRFWHSFGIINWVKVRLN